MILSKIKKNQYLKYCKLKVYNAINIKKYHNIKVRIRQYKKEFDHLIGIDIPFGFLFYQLKSLLDELKKYPKIKVIFIIPLNNPSNPSKTLMDNGIAYEDIIQYPYINKNNNVDIFFSPVNSYYDCFGSKIVKIIYAHALSGWGNGKATNGLSNIKNFDFMFTTGSTQEKVLSSFSFALGESLPKMVKVGYIFTDAINLNKEGFNRDLYLKEHSLNPNNITITYAPSWGITTSSVNHGLDIIKYLCSLNEHYNVIVKLHPALIHGRRRKVEYSVTGKINWKSELSNLQTVFKNLYHTTEEIDFGVYYVTDILITDISGIGFEFLLLNKNVIYFDVPEYFDKYGKEGPEYWARTGPIVTKINELNDSIKAYINNPNLYSVERQKINFELIYNPGTALKILVSELLNILNYNDSVSN